MLDLSIWLNFIKEGTRYLGLFLTQVPVANAFIKKKVFLYGISAYSIER